MLWDRLRQAEIEFTLHWGKYNPHLTKARVKKMYGDKVTKWKESREALLESPAVVDVFTNDFLRRVYPQLDSIVGTRVVSTWR